MKNALRHTLLAVGLLLAGSAWAQMSPAGTWHTIDEQTNQPRTEVVISDNGGVLTGRITRLLRPGADQAARCTACTDDRKDQPLIGLEIIRGARQAEGRTVWESGRILDPEDGRTYTLRMTPIEAGRKLQVRGSIGPFGRTQTWVRVQ
ncbi:uncharacterized protein conserved in bacteria [Serpentinimonas raichei]|uniref:Uncharacterized protein conserved in bacteria n=1 Tax=Serpentinimonas raichei TaxID=1458425 RepID=A0A060NI78_9BURK|nr:DUF2147 domain-containing protein [Serpentinimonas raichei]BAO81756.1 uncharacterized protein conserved in bacteria [Serpentinimonas raichei]